MDDAAVQKVETTVTAWTYSSHDQFSMFTKWTIDRTLQCIRFETLNLKNLWIIFDDIKDDGVNLL